MDCGLYATATATQLCHGELPRSVVWNQMLMQSHLLKCFECGKLEPFPGGRLDGVIKEEVIVKQAVPVYCTCTCRMFDNLKNEMALCSHCKEWLHQKCQNIHPYVFKRRDKYMYVCSNCAEQ